MDETISGDITGEFSDGGADTSTEDRQQPARQNRSEPPGTSTSTPPVNLPMLTGSIVLAVLLQTVDSTIANVALPSMQGHFSSSQDEITWILTSYIVAAAIATPLTGALSKRWGVKRLLLLSVSGFMIASVLCGIANTFSQIIAFRLLQGLFGAALSPLAQSILLDFYPRDKQGQAMALYGGGVMVGPIIGPTLGGWLTDSFSWRWIFLINVPIGALALAGVITFLPARKSQEPSRFDWFGFATLAISIGALQLLLDRGDQLDWFGSVEIQVEALIAVVSFAFFVVHTATAGSISFFRRELLFDTNFVIATTYLFVAFAVIYSTRALLPPMLQNLMGYPIITTGFVTAPSGAGTMIVMLIVGRLVDRVDRRLLIVIGLGISALSMWQMARFPLAISEADIIWPNLLQGVGLGFLFVPLSTTAYSTLRRDLTADAASINSLMRNIGGSIGIAVVQTILTRSEQIVHAELAAQVTPFSPAIQALPEGGSPVELALLNVTINQQAEMIGYLNNFKMMFVGTLLLIPLVALIKKPGHRKQGDADAVHIALE